MEEEKETKTFQDEVIEQAETKARELLQNGIKREDINYLKEVIDIHKDMTTEKNMLEGGEAGMRYTTYSRDFSGNGYGNNYRGYNGYNGPKSGAYGRRGVDAKYRGEEMLEEMHQAYNDYNDGASYGEYGTQESMQKIEIMGDALVDFVDHIKRTVKSPEEREIIDRKIQELSRM